MAVQWTTIEVPLGAGLDTKTNEKLLKPPFVADLSDAVFPASGADGYETRLGYDRVRTNTTLTDIATIASRDNELIALADDKLYSVSELNGNVDVYSKGALLAVNVTQETLDTQSDNQTDGQVITQSGVRVHSWYDSGSSTIQYTTADSVTGTLISSNNSIANSTRAKLCRVNNAILLVYYNSSATSLRCTVIPTFAPTSTTDVELQADAHSDAVFDVEESVGHDSVFCAYKRDNGGTPEVSSFLIDESGGVSGKVTVTAVAAERNAVCLAVCVGQTRYFVAVASSTNVSLFRSDTANIPVITSWSTNTYVLASVVNIGFRVERTAGQVEASDTYWLWTEFAGASAQFDRVEITTADGIANVDPTSSTTTVRHSSLASSSVLINNEGWVHLAHDTAQQRTFFLTDGSGVVHAKCCTGIGGGSISPHLPRVIDNIWAPVFREHLEIDVDPDIAETIANVFAQSGLKLVSYDLTHRPGIVQYGRTAYVASGVLWAYDGVQLVEQGFHIYPELVTSVTANSTGSLDNDTSYSYRVYYEWTNARGERQRSTTSEIVTQATGSSDDTNTLTIPTLSHGSKGADVSIVVYRTVGDPIITGGAPFYRVSHSDPEQVGAALNRYVANDPTSDTVAFIDGLADADIRVRELDYLNTGELDNTASQSAHIIGEAKSRVFVAGTEKQSRAYYSKKNNRGRDQLEFHDGLFIDVPEEGGPITAFGSLNHYLVVFKSDSCYAISGEGRSNLGSGFFNLPQVVSLDVGCIEQRSIVNVPAGIMFKSNKGIWILGQNLQVQYIGSFVESFNDQDITNATVIPEENHVIFLTSSGSALVYNYLVNAWSRWTNHAGHGGVIWNGVYTYARTDGKLYKQSATAYTDDGVHYAMKFRTAPVGVKGIQGNQRIRSVRLLGTYFNPHELRLGLRYNHEPGVSDTGTWDPSDGISVDLYGEGAYGSGSYGGSGSPVYQVRFNLPRQKCQVVQFEIDTTNTGNAGRAMSIQAIQIEVGAKRGLHDLSVNSSFSATGGSTT